MSRVFGGGLVLLHLLLLLVLLDLLLVLQVRLLCLQLLAALLQLLPDFLPLRQRRLLGLLILVVVGLKQVDFVAEIVILVVAAGVFLNPFPHLLLVVSEIHTSNLGGVSGDAAHDAGVADVEGLDLLHHLLVQVDLVLIVVFILLVLALLLLVVVVVVLVVVIRRLAALLFSVDRKELLQQIWIDVGFAALLAVGSVLVFHLVLDQLHDDV